MSTAAFTKGAQRLSWSASLGLLSRGSHHLFTEPGNLERGWARSPLPGDSASLRLNLSRAPFQDVWVISLDISSSRSMGIEGARSDFSLADSVLVLPVRYCSSIHS